MTLQSSYQPFLIGEGKSKTGLFNYLESWVGPQDAFDTLKDAYVYRGSVYQRSGFTLFPSLKAQGALVYAGTSSLLAKNISGAPRTAFQYNSGGAVALSPLPLTPGTVVIVVQTNEGTETFTDDGLGNLSGSLGDTGTINDYTDGHWFLTMTGTRNIPINASVRFYIEFVPTNAMPSVNNPIMGIKQFIDESEGVNVLVVMDTRRMSWWNSTTQSFEAVNQFQQDIYQFPSPNTLTAPPINPLLPGWPNVTPLSITLTISQPTAGTSVYNDDGAGLFVLQTGPGILNLVTSNINYATGAVTLNTNMPPNALTLVTFQGAVDGDYFTGNNTNFFNSVNWDAPDIPAFLYLTNNVDRITRFTIKNGTAFMSRPAFALYKSSVSLRDPSQVLLPYRNDVARALDIKVFKNSLILLRPTIFDEGATEPRIFSENQAIYYSCPVNSLSFSPTNFVLPTEVAGNGGFISASTGDILQCAQLLRDGLVVFYSNSTWFFRATGIFNNPFRFDQLNTSKSTNAPYGSVAYDQICTSMGAKGLISCDGVGVDRYDIKVITAWEDINQSSFAQCFAQKYDTLNQTWMLYPSEADDNSTSDSVLVYNFLEDSWATYKPNLGLNIQDPTKNNTLSCLGLGFTTKDVQWKDFAVNSGTAVEGLTRAQATFPWNDQLEQSLSPLLLAGDQNGFVYICNDGPQDTPGPDGSLSLGIPTVIQTNRLNPYVSTGEKTRYGYVDIYYSVDPSITLTMNFYCNNSNNVDLAKIITLDGNTNNVFAWKRIYLNVIGEFIQIEINSKIDEQNGQPVYNSNGNFQILGMIVWAMPAGRLTPGLFL